VDLDLAQIRDDVAGDATGDAHGAHALAIREPLDVHLFGAVLGEAAEDRCGRVDRVLADPRPRAVRAYAMGADDRTQGAVAAALHLTVRRLSEDREVRGEEIGAIDR